MPREQVHYEGTLIELPTRLLPGGGWLEWDITWRGPDGTRHPVTRLRTETEGGTATPRSQGGRGWRFHVEGSETEIVSPPARNRMRTRRREIISATQVTVIALALIEGEWMRVARQAVAL